MPFSPVTGRSGALFLVVFLAAPRGWGSDLDTAPLSPDQAVVQALAAHPDLRAAEMALATARGARAGATMFLANPQADAWLAPGADRAELAITQPLSLTGEGWHARRSAAAAVEAGTHGLARTRLEVAAGTRRAYVDAAVGASTAAAAQVGAELAGRLRFAVTRQHEEGEASTLDLRLARLAEVQAAARLLGARRAEAEALRALAVWVGTPVNTQQLLPDPLAAAPEPDLTAAPQRSDIRAATATVASARAALSRQRAAAVGPVAVGVGLETEGGDTAFGPALSLTLPLFDRNQAAIRGARGALAVAEAELRVATARAGTEQQTALVRVTEAEPLGALAGPNALDEAAAALASIESGVLAGEIDLSTAVLLQAEIFDGEAAIATLRGLVADARIDLLLASEDTDLLGGAE